MKYIKYLLLLALLIPQITFGAIAVGWQATSTDLGFITPNAVNGSLFGIRIGKQATFQIPISGSVAQFVGLDANPLRLTFDTHNNGSTSGTALMFRRSRGTSATPLADTLDDVLGSLNFRGYGTTGYAAGSTGLMTAKSEGAFTDTSMPTAITFDTTALNSVTATEKLRIQGNGNVDIGTTTGYAKLTLWGNGIGTGQTFEVANSASTTLFMVWDSGQAYSAGNFGIGTTNPSSRLTISGSESSADGLGASIKLSNTASGGADWYLRSGATGNNTPAGGFSIADNGGYRLVINSSGNVGVSSTTPGSLFAIGGDKTGINFGDNATTTFSGKGINILNGCYAINGTCLSTSAGAGDITSVGNVASGAAFDGTQGNILTFFNGGGNGTFLYDGTMFETTHPLAISTTTGTYNLESYSSTAPQIALSNGAGIAQWTLANLGGNFYLGTTTVAGTATSSVAALTVLGSTGSVYIATTTTNTARLVIQGPTTDLKSLVISSPNSSASQVFSLEDLTLSTDLNTGKAFSFQVKGEGVARGMFYSDGKYCMGPGGVSSRDTCLTRGGTSTLKISSDGSTGIATLNVTGAISAATTSPSTTSGAVLSLGGNGTGINFYDNGTTTSSGQGMNLAKGGCFAIATICGAVKDGGDDIKAYQAMGSQIIAQTISVDAFTDSVNGVALVDGQASFMAIWLDKPQTVTGVKWYQVTAGSYTADNYNGVALYSYSGGNMTVVASSTNDGTIWAAGSNTTASKAFATPYNAPSGLYFIGFIYNQSAQVTAPSLATASHTMSSTSHVGLDFTNSAKLQSTISGAVFPVTQAMSGTTARTVFHWAAIY